MDFEKLEMEVWTNDSITPNDAVSLAAQFLVNHFTVVSSLNEIIAQNDFMHEPETPVTATNLPSGISTSIFLRLFSLAPFITIDLPLPFLLSVGTAILRLPAKY